MYHCTSDRDVLLILIDMRILPYAAIWFSCYSIMYHFKFDLREVYTLYILYSMCTVMFYIDQNTYF